MTKETELYWLTKNAGYYTKQKTLSFSTETEFNTYKIKHGYHKSLRT